MYVCGGAEDVILNERGIISACKEYLYLGTQIEKTEGTKKQIEGSIMKIRKVVGALNSTLCCDPNPSQFKESTF